MTSPLFVKSYKPPSTFFRPSSAPSKPPAMIHCFEREEGANLNIKTASANLLALTDEKKKQGEKPVPKPRTKKKISPNFSPLSRKSKVECMDWPGEVTSASKPRPHSIHGEDSLKEYEFGQISELQERATNPSTPPSKAALWKQRKFPGYVAGSQSSKPTKVQVDDISQPRLPPVEYDDHMSMVMYSIEPAVSGAPKPLKVTGF